jgi:hypothetical protein
VSHVTQIDLDVKDLDALAVACEELGLELRRGQTTYKWWGKHVGDFPVPQGFTVDDLGKCDHAISVKGNPKAYEVGLVKRRDGRPGYTLLYDFWAGGCGLMEKVGEECKALRQRYSVVVAEKAARKQGFRTQRRTLENGQMQVVARR